MKDRRIRLAFYLQTNQVLLAEENVRFERLFWLNLFPEHLKPAVLYQGDHEMTSVYEVEVQLKTKVGLCMG